MLILGMVAVAAVGLSLAHLAGRAQIMAQAQTAADASALAGVRHQRLAAAQLAVANGAVLSDFDHTGGVAWAQVTLGDVQATASAQAATADLVPALAAAVERAGDVIGLDVAALARPLGPQGREGLLLEPSVAARLAPLGHRTGLCRAPGGRPLHFVTCPATHRP